MTSGPAATLTLALGAAAVRVRSMGEAALRWLVEFACPPLSVVTGDAPPADATVDLVFDAEEREALRARGREGGPEVACFTLDGGHQRFPLWLEDEGWSVLRDARSDAFVAARGGTPGRPLEVRVTAGADGPRARILLLRAVREVLSARAVAAGQVAIHGAAAADAAGRAFVLVGPKNSGKTSLLLHALGRPGMRYITNDRALLDAAPETPVVRGVPTIVRLRPGALELFPALGPRLREGAFDRARTFEECARLPVDASLPWPPGLTPAQLRRALGVEGVVGGPLRAVVLVRVDPGGPACALERLASEEAARRLVRHGLVAEGACAGFLARPALPALDVETIEARLRSACARAVVLSCALGPRAYDDPPAWTAIERAVGTPT